MANIAQVLATGGTALVSTAAGAGLTYWLGALNRRYQEAREDRTRWYQDRFRTYAELSRAYANANYRRGDSPEFKETVEELATAVARQSSLSAPPRLRRYQFALALRELARRREPVRVALVDGTRVDGTIEAVGSDYLEVAEHDPGEARRRAAVRARRFVGFAAVATVSLPPARR